MIVATSALGDLRAMVGAEFLVTGEALEAYRLGGRKPQAAIVPADDVEVSKTLARAWEEGLAVVPWGGGTHQSVGPPPSRYDLALDLGRLNRLLVHEPADMTATAQAGIRMVELQRQLAQHRQFLPLDVPLPERAMLGGVLSAKSSGPLRCRYGTARDLVLGLRVAHADGTLTKSGAKVVKNATGYDVTKLYLGSHGTLGIILEATLRVYPRPDVEQGWWLEAHDLATAQALANRILGSHLVPNRVEMVDEVAGRACGMPGPGLVVSIAGLPESVQGQRATLERMAAESGVMPAEIRDAEGTWRALSDFPWVNVGWNGGGVQALWRGGAPPADCAKAMLAIRQAAPRSVGVSAAATVAHGILRGGFLAEAPEAVAHGLRAAREVLVAIGGFLTVLDAPAPVRAQVDAWGPAPDGVGVMQRLKAAFDPKGILNPGRFVGGI
jgi:glycolate oxidase FAD binding subunit